jgi:hypothetical protein
MKIQMHIWGGENGHDSRSVRAVNNRNNITQRGHCAAAQRCATRAINSWERTAMKSSSALDPLLLMTARPAYQR